MSDVVNTEENPVGLEENGTEFIEILQVIAENLRLLVIAPLAVGILALGLSYAVTPTFTATATFLPPQQQQGMASSVLQSLGALGGLAGAASGLKNPTDQYVSFLKSNAVEDALIKRFDLINRYEEKFVQDTRNTLEKKGRIAAGKDNIIVIEFDDHDPIFAANVANAYAEELTRLLGRLAVTEAQQRRVFFSKQLVATKEALVKAEQDLAATGVSVATLNANPATALEGPARLRAQVTVQEVKIASMRSYLADAAPELRQAQAELSALKQELTRAEVAQPASPRGTSDYIAKYREFKYQETLFDLFSRQYELARIDESREGAVIQVVDAATPPEKKSKPKRAILAAGAVFLSGVLLLIFVFFRNAVRNAQNTPEFAKKYRNLNTTFWRALGRNS